VKPLLLAVTSLVAAACVAMPVAAPAQNVPAPSDALVQALASARSAGMPAIVAWAAQPVAPAAATGAVSAAELEILALAPPDRDAMLFWLDAHGRGALHARGASDGDIGVPYYPIDYAIVPAPFPASVTPLVMPAIELPAPTPIPAPARHHGFGFLGSLLPALNLPIASSSSSSTSTSTTQNGNSTQFNQTTQSSGTSVSIGGNPWEAVGSLIDASMDRASSRSAPDQPWRNLPFATSTLSAPGSQILVNRGFAAVRYDGTEGVACISFLNQAPVAVTRVDVDIEILDGLGFVKRVQALRRSGPFAAGAEIGGPSGPQTVENARANCIIDGENRLADASDPFARASAVVYAVRQVFYADGTSWLQPGANPWPP
jgi:hypothetical protein